MTRRLATLALVLTLTLPVPVVAQSPPSDTQLKTGISLVEDGDLENAVLTLGSVVQRLSGEKGHEKDLAIAHLYLAMAHLGLSRVENAKAEVLAAWRNNKEMSLDPTKFPPTLLKLYEEAKRAPATPPPSQRKGGSKAPWIILGVAAAGGGVALAAKGGGSSAAARPPLPPPLPPSVTIAASNGAGITGVTVLTFTATATQLTSPTFTWNFGDGATDSGASVQHRFDAEGTFNVLVTATGAEGTATASVNVLSRSLTGAWADAVLPCPATAYCRLFNFVQQGTTLAGGETNFGPNLGCQGCNQASGPIVNGAIAAPFRITWTESILCLNVYTGTVSNDLNSINGTRTSPFFSCDGGGNFVFHRQ